MKTEPAKAPASGLAPGHGSAPASEPLAWIPKNRIHLQGFAPVGFQTWSVFAPADVTAPEQIPQHPELWADKTRDLQAYDHIIVVAADEGWIAHFVIHEVWVGGASTVLLNKATLPPKRSVAGDRLSELFEIANDPATGGWYSRRKSDGVYLIQGAATKEHATRHTLDHATLRLGNPT